MKKLVLINGTMGVGKTSLCEELLLRIPQCVFLDGDWCWRMQPFVVTDETKAMVIDNAAHLLRNFLRCSALETVLFCWVMHRDEIIQELLQAIGDDVEYELHKLTLIASEEELRRRLSRDIEAQIREDSIIERSVERLPLYRAMDTVKLPVDGLTVRETADRAIRLIGGNA